MSKHKNQIHQLEALLLGQAGLLEDKFSGSYPIMLQREYQFLRKKYALRRINASIHFLRMRPNGFPTVRLAQLAMLIHRSTHLFSTMKDAAGIRELKNALNVTANDYWHYHYAMDEESPYLPKSLGLQMVNNIIINTIAPIVFTYGHLHQKENYKDKSIDWIRQTGKEKNAITRSFARLGIANDNAADSQSLIELKTQYCDKRRCLDCAIGNAILKRSNS